MFIVHTETSQKIIKLCNMKFARELIQFYNLNCKFSSKEITLLLNLQFYPVDLHNLHMKIYRANAIECIYRYDNKRNLKITKC